MLSVTNMLNYKQQQEEQRLSHTHQHQYSHHQYTQQKEIYKRPAVLDISNLLNTTFQPKSPSLSPSLTSSPASISSFTSYPFPTQNEWQDIKHRSNTPISMENEEIDMLEEDEDEEDDEADETEVEDETEEDDDESSAIKAKRRRANTKQLEVLNRVFDRTFFPSTQMRAELGRQLGMSPRTVQIWFQNRRQAMRTRERQRLIRLRNNDSKQTTTE